MLSWIGRPANPPSQLIVDEIADEPRVAPELRRSIPGHLIHCRGKPWIKRIGCPSPPQFTVQPERHAVRQAMYRPQFRLAPIADRVKPPRHEPTHRFFLPALSPIRTKFALKVSSIEVEGATMIERAVALGPHTGTVVSLAPVGGKLSTRRRKVAKHKLATVDIGFPSERNHVHPDREEAVAVRRHEPPSPITLFGSEEAGRAKASGVQKPAEAVALREIGEPLRECALFLVPFGTEHLDGAHLLRPLTRQELAEAVDDAVVGAVIRLDVQRPDHERSRARWTQQP